MALICSVATGHMLAAVPISWLSLSADRFSSLPDTAVGGENLPAVEAPARVEALGRGLHRHGDALVDLEPADKGGQIVLAGLAVGLGHRQVRGHRAGAGVAVQEQSSQSRKSLIMPLARRRW